MSNEDALQLVKQNQFKNSDNPGAPLLPSDVHYRGLPKTESPISEKTKEVGMAKRNQDAHRMIKKIRKRTKEEFGEDEDDGFTWDEKEVFSNEDRVDEDGRIIREIKYLKVKSRPNVGPVDSDEFKQIIGRKRGHRGKLTPEEFEKMDESEVHKTVGKGRKGLKREETRKQEYKKESRKEYRIKEHGEAGGKIWQNIDGKKEWKNVGEKNWHPASDKEWEEFMKLFKESGGRRKRWGESGNVEWRDVNGRRDLKISGEHWRKAGNDEWKEIFGGGGGHRREQRDGGIQEWGDFRSMEWRVFADGRKELKGRDDRAWRTVSDSEFNKTIGKEWRLHGHRFPKRFGVEAGNIEWREIDGSKEYRASKDDRWKEVDEERWEEFGGKSERKFAEADKRNIKLVRFQEDENKKAAEYEERKANLAREEKSKLIKSYTDHKEELVNMEKKRVVISFDNEKDRLKNVHEANQKKITEEKANLEKETYEMKLRQEKEKLKLKKGKDLNEVNITEKNSILEEEERKKQVIAGEHERLEKLEMQKKEQLKREQDILDQKQAARLKELEAEKRSLSSKLAIKGGQFEKTNGRAKESMTDDNSEDGDTNQNYYLSERPVPDAEIGFNVKKKIKDFETKERKIAGQVKRDRQYPKKEGIGKKQSKVQVPGRVKLGW